MTLELNLGSHNRLDHIGQHAVDSFRRQRQNQKCFLRKSFIISRQSSNSAKKMRPSSSCFLFAVVVAVLFAAIAESQLTPILTVEISQKVARVDDEVTFTCRVTGLTASTLTLNKIIVQPEQKFLSEQISINDVLSRPYKAFPRFSVTKTTDGETQLLVLRIKGVKLEDSGHYACAEPSIDNLYNMEILEVYRKPQNVSIVGYPITDLSTMVLQENQKADNLSCVVPDVLPIPTVQMWLERGMISPKDITEDFVLGSELKIWCSENTLEKTCPLHMSYTMIALNRDFIPSFLNDGKQLTCTAKMNQLDHDEMSSTVTLSVIYAPKFLCAGVWNGTVNMTDLKVVCQVYANPPSSRLNKSVTIKTQEGFFIIRPGDNTPDYSLEDKPLVSTDLKVTSLEFLIKTVTEEHFTYVYYLYATNAAGNTTKEITIAKIVTFPAGAESLGSTNIFTVVLSIVLALAFNKI